MLEKTRGIVLNYIKFKESSIITKIYTEKLGLQSYIVNGLRSKSSKKSIAIFQPLSLLDIVAYHKKGQSGSLSRLSEYKNAHPFASIPFDIKKTTISIFISEFLSKVIKEETEDSGGQFNFLFSAIQSFDLIESGYEGFHLHLMTKLANYLGFGVYDSKQMAILDRDQPGVWSEECMNFVLQLQSESIMSFPICPNTVRHEALNYLINYYRNHIESFGEMKSIDVLKQLFA